MHKLKPGLADVKQRHRPPQGPVPAQRHLLNTIFSRGFVVFRGPAVRRRRHLENAHPEVYNRPTSTELDDVCLAATIDLKRTFRQLFQLVDGAGCSTFRIRHIPHDHVHNGRVQKASP